MHATLASILLAVWAGAAGAQAEPVSADAGWSFIEAPGFRVEFPSGAERTNQTAETAAGPLTITIWGIAAKDSFLGFTHTDFPVSMVENALPFQLLDRGRDGALANVGGQLEKEVQLMVESGTPGKLWPARRVTAGGPQGMRLELFLCLAGSRLYQVIEVRASSTAAPSRIQRVVSGLRLSPFQADGQAVTKQP